MLDIRLGSKTEINEINSLSSKYLNETTDWIFWYELLCPFWLKWAVIKSQVIIVKENEKIKWFLRFYPRKRDNIVSIYQFALNEDIRWKWIIKKCLEKTWYKIFEIQCKKNINFNNYYKKTWWELFKEDENFNYYKLIL